MFKNHTDIVCGMVEIEHDIVQGTSDKRFVASLSASYSSKNFFLEKLEDAVDGTDFSIVEKSLLFSLCFLRHHGITFCSSYRHAESQRE